jgi:hypothetical protein
MSERGAPSRPFPITEPDQRKLLADWIEGIKTRFKVEVPAIAARTTPPTSPSTIYRWLDPDNPFNPSLAKIRQIARAFSIPMPPLESVEQEGFAEPENAEYRADDDFEGLVAAENQRCWRITSRVLELAGYRPGDVVLVDFTVTPQADDIACVEMYDFISGTTKTRFRVYNPPFLETATMDPRLKEAPVLVDGKSVVVVGTVVRSIRVRRRS